MPDLLEILDDVIRAHAEARRGGLLHDRAGEAAVQADEAVLAQHHLDAVQRGGVAPGAAGVVDQGRLDALRGRDGRGAGDHAGGHAREHVAARG